MLLVLLVLLFVHFLNNLKAVFLCETRGHHALFELLKRSLFFVLEHLKALDQGLFCRFELLSFLLVLVDQLLLLLSARLLVGLADADLVHAKLVDFVTTFGGHLSDAFTLGLFVHKILIFKMLLPSEVLVEFITN